MPEQAGRAATDKLHQLEGEVLALGNLVEDLLIGAADLLHDGDLGALERLSDEERQVHKKRLAIELGCLSLLASRRPLGGDLPRLVAMVEVAAELERLSDHARRVARANCLIAGPPLHTSLASLHRLAAEVQVLLDGALAAFGRRDAGAARTVAAGVRDVERLYGQVRHELLAVMSSQPRIANQALFLSRSAYNLRRAAQRVIGICDWVVFAVEGSLEAGAPPGPDSMHPLEEASIPV
jgi:phosphate transport system protein